MSDFPEGRRIGTRKQCFAKALLKNSKTIGYLADISESGFKIRIMERLDREASEKETIGIQFDECAIQYFQVKAKLCWRRDEEKSTLLGYRTESFETAEGSTGYESIRKLYGDGAKGDFT